MLRLTIWILEESHCLEPMVAMMTPHNPSRATPAPAIWTRASAPVGEEPQHPPRPATSGLVSRSSCIEIPDEIVSLPGAGPDCVDVPPAPRVSVGVHVNPLHPPCPIIVPRPSELVTNAKCDPMPRKPCGSTQTLKHQENPLHLPMQQSKPFPLFWYFSTEKKRNGELKERKKKVRVPAKKLLYYTKGGNQTFSLQNVPL